MAKKFILKLADFLSLVWRIIPFRLRRFIFTSLFIFESRDESIKNGLSRIFYINERAIKYENGIHPKHRLTNYHKFFIDRIKDGNTVLDVGCGNGVVALDIAFAKPHSLVIGIDINKKNIQKAEKLKKLNNLKNINFTFGDITKHKGFKSDVVLLSNILEHIEQREIFLKQIIKKSEANIFLIRVPLFQRDWQLALRKELGIYYYSDYDHKIEHNVDELKNELQKVNLRIKELYTIWGEIWAECIYER
ncbi:class I SAM-dependent methyltransferase [Prochlorococcus sp. AH-716-O13]|nr:class I SAM-dependent methyltransferase [Prochlorococcus sp. AH-716-O13]